MRMFSCFYLLAATFNKFQGSEVFVRTYRVSFVYFLPKVIPSFIRKGGLTCVGALRLFPFLLLKNPSPRQLLVFIHLTS